MNDTEPQDILRLHADFDPTTVICLSHKKGEFMVDFSTPCELHTLTLLSKMLETEIIHLTQIMMAERRNDDKNPPH